MEPIKKATHIGKIKLGTHEIEVVILEDGTRLITEDGLVQFTKCLTDGVFDENDALEFWKQMKSKPIPTES